MLRRPEHGKRAPPPPLDSGNGASRLLHDIEALSKALSINKRTPVPKSLPSSAAAEHHRRPRSISAGKSDFTEPRSKPRSAVKDPAVPPSRKEKKPSSSASSSSSSLSSSSSFWNWKPLKALSHIRHRRFDCRFTLHVHSIEGLPPVFNDSSLCVHWKRAGNGADAAAGRTRHVRVFHGVVEFEEVMAHRCSVYGSRSGQLHSAKYESRQFVLYASVVSAPEVDLGKHRVDLTRLLPITLEELEEETSSGKWSTNFKLSGKGRGAVLNVSFGYSVVKDGLVEPAGNRKVVSVTRVSGDAVAGDWQGSLRRTGNLPGPHHVQRDRSRLPSRSVEDVKVLHEVYPTSRSVKSVMENLEQTAVHEKYVEDELGDPEYGLKPQFEVFTLHDDSLLELKSSVIPEPVKGDNQKECDVVQEPVKETEEVGPMQEQVKADEEKEGYIPEFTVIEQGIEMSGENQMKGNAEETLELDEAGNADSGEVVEEQNPEVEQPLPTDAIPLENNMAVDDSGIEELDSAFRELSILESVGLNSPGAKAETPGLLSDKETKSNYKMGKISKSLSLDDVTESVASEFLNMLGIDHSPFGVSSESEPESPRDRIWKQFEKESLSIRDIESPRECLWRQFEKDSLDIENNLFTGGDLDCAAEMDWGEDIDLNSIVNAAETEHQKATQAMKSKTRAKLLEDAETEALMREWGLNEKAFQNSPSGSRCGFGSPIDLPPEEPLDLPPLGDDLGPFLQTKDGGFLRSMSPSLFKNAKNKGSLIMQVSSPVVVPAQMGSGIMEILQGLASVGIEKLSMQASKLMPLEDITGKTMQQVAWEGLPALEADERQDFMQLWEPDVESGLCGNAFGDRRKSKSMNLSSSRSSETSTEYVSLEDLAPLAMDKIEALSIEGLRIQSGMSDDEAPSNISPQSIGEISALEGKVARNGGSLGLEGAAGLQLLDVKDTGDSVDGLMGLSLTLDEWMKLDSGIVDEEDLNSERTSKILAAHHASSAELMSGGLKGDKRGGKSSGRRWGLLGNNFTVALMVQLRDPLRNYEPVGTPMLALIQVERVFVPPKPKIYSTVSDRGNSEQDDEELEKKPDSILKDEKKEEEEIVEPVPQFKITEVHVAGLKTEPGKKKLWGNQTQHQSGSRWMLASGMGKNNKHPFMKSKTVTKPSQSTTTVQPGDTLWSISSRVHGTGEKWKELATLNPHIRNPNVIFPNETIRLR